MRHGSSSAGTLEHEEGSWTAMRRILVTSASGANGDGYGTLLCFSAGGKLAGPFSEALESMYANIIKQGSLPPPVDWHPAAD